MWLCCCKYSELPQFPIILISSISVGGSKGFHICMCVCVWYVICTYHRYMLIMFMCVYMYACLCVHVRCLLTDCIVCYWAMQGLRHN